MATNASANARACRSRRVARWFRTCVSVAVIVAPRIAMTPAISTTVCAHDHPVPAAIRISLIVVENGAEKKLQTRPRAAGPDGSDVGRAGEPYGGGVALDHHQSRGRRARGGRGRGGRGARGGGRGAGRAGGRAGDGGQS